MEQRTTGPTSVDPSGTTAAVGAEAPAGQQEGVPRAAAARAASAVHSCRGGGRDAAETEDERRS